MPMPQIIQNWAPDNKTIVEGHYDRKIATFFDADDKNEQFKNLHKTLVKWAVLCGVRPLPNDEEMFLFVEYIAHHFYRFSILEVDNAFNLATAGKLGMDADHYQSFSVIYISKILNAYKDFKGKYILEYKKIEEEKSNKPLTEEEQFEKMIENTIINYESYAKEPYFNEFGYVIYDFLSNIGVIKFTSEEKTEILNISKEKVIENLQEEKRGEQPSTARHIQLSSLINTIKEDKKGGDKKVVLMCKNVGLCRYYDFILKNNISLKSEIQKALTR